MDIHDRRHYADLALIVLLEVAILSTGSVCTQTLNQETWQYDYDAAGNITYRAGTDSSTTYAYDSLHRPTQEQPSA